MSHASAASISITGLPGVVIVMSGKGRFSGLFLSLTISAGFLSSNGIKSSSIKFCKILLSRGWCWCWGGLRFFKMLSDRARISTSSVFGGAVGGIFVGLIGGSTVTMFGLGLGIFKTGMVFV